MSNVGERLRAKREERGLSLKDVEQALSIRVKYLQAIEDEEYAVIPGEVYVKGFIRNYANYLGFNGEDIVKQYKESQIQQPVPAQPAAPTASPSESQDAKIATPKVESNSPMLYWILAGIVVIAGAGYYLFNQFSGSPTPVPPASPPSTQAPTPSAPKPTVPPIPQPQPQTPVKPVVQGVQLGAKFTAECWVLVIVDGNEAFEGVAAAGETKSWQAKNTIEITLGNAGGADLTVNGQPQAPLGKPGDVVRQVYKSQG